MLLLIDNYDSFTYNLVQYFQSLNQSVKVIKNDAISADELPGLNPDYLVISPGPNSPKESGISIEAIAYFHNRIPTLGICLGHQCIAEYFGATIQKAPEVVHGKTSPILHHKLGLFEGIPNLFQATRYHSLCINPSTLPTSFSIDAWASDTIMAISHRQLPLFGLQFHPEAILTEHGLAILSNFLTIKQHESNP